MPLTAYPLCWPDGWRRTPAGERSRGHFNRKEQHAQGERTWTQTHELSVADATARILYELERMDIGRDDVIISTNVPTRLDGLPRSDRNPVDPGAAVYWRPDVMRPATKCMAIDRYDRVADNLAAIAATIEAMRAIQRHGGAEILERAFRGFAALPERASQTWRQVLNLPHDPVTLDAVEARYRELVKVHHPDAGGHRDQFEEITRAREDARRELSGA